MKKILILKEDNVDYIEFYYMLQEFHLLNNDFIIPYNSTECDILYILNKKFKNDVNNSKVQIRKYKQHYQKTFLIEFDNKQYIVDPRDIKTYGKLL